MLRMLPRAMELRTVTPCSISGKERSSTYRACPVTLLRPSVRGREDPIRRSVIRSQRLCWQVIEEVECIIPQQAYSSEMGNLNGETGGEGGIRTPDRAFDPITV